MLDSKLSRETYLEGVGLEPLKRKKITHSYKKWLIKDAKVRNLDISFKPKSKYYSTTCCYYCCYCTVPIALLFGTFSLVYSPQFARWIITPGIIFLAILTFFLMDRSSNNEVYKKLNSEMKQILFEEETSYKALKKRKMTYKYKSWLIENQKKEESFYFDMYEK